MEGIVNPELVRIAENKTKHIDFDVLLDSSHISALMEDHVNSVFPQFQQTDRPDVLAAALASGKVVWLVDNTPFALVAPITFFYMFQSPEDYVHRWMVSSFLRGLRFVAFVVALLLTPAYVAVTVHHYQMVPLEMLFVLISQFVHPPFWEALLMLLTLEILKEASLRMPTSLQPDARHHGRYCHRSSGRGSRNCKQCDGHCDRHLRYRLVSRTQLFDDEREQAAPIYPARSGGLAWHVGHRVWFALAVHPPVRADFARTTVFVSA